MSERLIGAIEAGGTKFVLALAGESGAVRAHTRIPTETPAITMRAMADFFTGTAAAHGAIAAFGIGSFGPIELDRAAPRWGSITTTSKPGWSGASFPQALAGFGAPLAIATDVEAAALGEWTSGAACGLDTIAYATIGTGIGAAVLQRGVPVRGLSHLEAGHIRLPRQPGDGYAGWCSYHRDCAEGLASGPAIAGRWGARLDQLGTAERALIAAYLGDWVAALVMMHMPQRVILGGGVMETPGLLAAVRIAAEGALARFVAHAALDPGLGAFLAAPALGGDAGIRGAIELARRALPPR